MYTLVAASEFILRPESSSHYYFASRFGWILLYPSDQWDPFASLVNYHPEVWLLAFVALHGGSGGLRWAALEIIQANDNFFFQWSFVMTVIYIMLSRAVNLTFAEATVAALRAALEENPEVLSSPISHLLSILSPLPPHSPSHFPSPSTSSDLPENVPKASKNHLTPPYCQI